MSIHNINVMYDNEPIVSSIKITIRANKKYYFVCTSESTFAVCIDCVIKRRLAISPSMNIKLFFLKL